MRWFGWLSAGLQRIGHYPATNIFQFIALFLSVPCFKASHFCFKRAYGLQQLHLSRLAGDCARLGGKDFSVQFPESIPEFGKVADLYQFLYCLARRLEG